MLDVVPKYIHNENAGVFALKRGPARKDARPMPDAANIHKYIKELREGSTLPEMLGKIISVVQDESSSSTDLSRLIAYDQALTESILRVANSAMFGHSGKIWDIEQAVMFLGYRQIKSIALGMTVMRMVPAGNSFSLKNLWVHGYEVACIANALGESVPATMARECFLSGLLHDIGRVILCRMAPERFFEVGVEDDFMQREQELFGCTHEQVGAWFLEDTKLPEEIVAPVLYHHRPKEARDFADATAIISYSEALSRLLNPEKENDGFWQPAHDEINRRLALSQEQISQIGGRLALMKREIGVFFR